MANGFNGFVLLSQTLAAPVRIEYECTAEPIGVSTPIWVGRRIGDSVALDKLPEDIQKEIDARRFTAPWSAGNAKIWGDDDRRIVYGCKWFTGLPDHSLEL